jgi:hypothetical protein
MGLRDYVRISLAHAAKGRSLWSSAKARPSNIGKAVITIDTDDRPTG